MTSMPGAIRRCIHILWPGKASEKTPREVVPSSLCEIPQNASRKRKEEEVHNFIMWALFFRTSFVRCNSWNYDIFFVCVNNNAFESRLNFT
jgi:hypothetical protein